MVYPPGDAPRTGSTGGRSLHQGRPHYVALAGADVAMPREPRMLISTSIIASIPEERRTERLSLRAAIFWIGVLSLGGWAGIIALVHALD
jgi:hypothetical protein